MTLFTIFVLQTDYLFCLLSRCYMHSEVFAVAFGIMSKRLNDAKIARCARWSKLYGDIENNYDYLVVWLD